MSANLLSNAGEIFSSSDKRITGLPHAPSELPAAFSGVLAFHRNERTGEHMPNREHYDCKGLLRSLVRAFPPETAMRHDAREFWFLEKTGSPPRTSGEEATLLQVPAQPTTGGISI